jgi:DNA-binding response OmpR family regulator
MTPEEKNAKCILVVEDDEKSMKLVTDILGLSGYRTLKALDGEQALNQFKAHTPDMVIADLNMPNLNGWKLGFWIKEKQKERKIPVIFISALIDAEGRPGANELGDYYFPKPFESSRLIKKIEELLKVNEVPDAGPRSQ